MGCTLVYSGAKAGLLVEMWEMRLASCEEELSSTQDLSPWGVSTSWKGVRMDRFRAGWSPCRQWAGK